MAIKKVVTIIPTPPGHWVGDGFPVCTMFSYNERGKELSPFLLLDYAGPAEFQASNCPRGVGEHPHRGFETVTIVYQGEVEHRDSSGAGGKIGPGDVQWMTAASGVVHEEMHSRDFTRQGGTLEMVQLWVNLPAKFKMSTPRYQEIISSRIPTVVLPDAGGTLRVIAGLFKEMAGPAKTFTPINLFDLRLKKGHRLELDLPDGHTTALLAMKGKITVNSSKEIPSVRLVILDQNGDRVAIEALDDSTVLIMSGEPIHEPIAGYGPFVMNTQEEIRRAREDYQNGRMGKIS